MHPDFAQIFNGAVQAGLWQMQKSSVAECNLGERLILGREPVKKIHKAIYSLHGLA